MDLQFTTEELAFRDEVRGFLKDKLPEDLSHKVKNGLQLSKQDMERWHAILNERGWLANHWPEQHGGPGWSAVQKFIFEHECALAGTPRIVPFGLSMLGPVLIKYGNEAQKAHWLPRILNGADWWCQGYSEPGSGSDLASVKTSAVRDGDHYIVNGQKTWTTLGQHANMIFCLVRTNREAKAQQGISFLLVDMNSPGVEVRPIITLDGEHEVNEVFFTDVKVPVENLVGEENKGWTYAKYLLEFERGNPYSPGLYSSLDEVREMAKETVVNGRPLAEDPSFKARYADLRSQITAMEFTELRIFSSLSIGGNVGPESSLLKCRGTEIQQEISQLMVEVLGDYAAPTIENGMIETNEPEVGPEGAFTAAPYYFSLRKASIYAGSNEVQRNIMAKAVLGL